MGLRTAVEDFTATTLACLAGPLRRLEYIAQLRDENGDDYQHWGMSRVHGVDAAQAAIAQAHSAVLLAVLRAPLSQLFIECRRGEEGIPPSMSKLPKLLPHDLGGGSELHLKSVLAALASLARVAERPTREAA